MGNRNPEKLIFQETEISYIPGNGSAKFIFQKVTFQAQKNREQTTLKKFLIFREMGLFSLKIRNVLKFKQETFKS